MDVKQPEGIDPLLNSPLVAPVVSAQGLGDFLSATGAIPKSKSPKAKNGNDGASSEQEPEIVPVEEVGQEYKDPLGDVAEDVSQLSVQNKSQDGGGSDGSQDGGYDGGQDGSSEWANSDEKEYEALSMMLGAMGVEVVDWLGFFLTYQSFKVSKGKYIRIETDPKLTPELRQDLRKLELTKIIDAHNERIKEALETDPEKKARIANLATVVLNKHFGRMQAPPEVILLGEIASLGFEKFQKAKSEFPEWNRQLKSTLDDSVAQIINAHQMREQKDEASKAH